MQFSKARLSAEQRFSRFADFWSGFTKPPRQAPCVNFSKAMLQARVLQQAFAGMNPKF